LFARIISIAESYDELLNDEEKYGRLSPDKVLDMIKKNSGIKYDPKLVRVLENLIVAKDS
jgi:HD-GYP domain-containing protein (c-di-GMP phosphodiesterase class II)